MVMIRALPVVRFLLALHDPPVFLEDTLREPHQQRPRGIKNARIFGRRMDSRPNVRLVRCSASSGTYVIHRSITIVWSLVRILSVWYGYSVRIVITSLLLSSGFVPRFWLNTSASPIGCLPSSRANV